MSEKDLLDKGMINNEVHRITLLFDKNHYDKEQRIWFIQSKIRRAKASRDLYLLAACNELLKEMKCIEE